MSRVNSPFAAYDDERIHSADRRAGQSRLDCVWRVEIALLVYGYGNMLIFTAHSWSDGLYSHGYIIPVFAAGLLWMRRGSP